MPGRFKVVLCTMRGAIQVLGFYLILCILQLNVFAIQSLISETAGRCPVKVQAYQWLDRRYGTKN